VFKSFFVQDLCYNVIAIIVAKRKFSVMTSTVTHFGSYRLFFYAGDIPEPLHIWVRVKIKWRILTCSCGAIGVVSPSVGWK